MKNDEGIYGFTSAYRFLSNFWYVDIMMYGQVYRSVEHAYQAAKATNAEDRERIRNCPSPAAAKQVGRKIKVREDWENVKLGVMEALLRRKFTHTSLKQDLVDTGSLYLEETNTWGDTFWGVCKGVGTNHLGLLLMKIRSNLEAENAAKQ